MTGQYKHSIDGKGRLAVPAKLRAELKDSFYLSLGTDGCLAFYPEEVWNRKMAKLDEIPEDKDSRDIQRIISSLACKCEPDTQWRVILPYKMRKFAEIEKEVVIIGVGSRAEIWDAARYEEMEAEQLSPEKLNKSIRLLGF